MSEINNQGPVHIRRGAYLPHWNRESAIYFVTFRLADSLPQELLKEWLWEQDCLIRNQGHGGQSLPSEEIAHIERAHSEKVEAYLDASHGVCWMQRNGIAAIVADALLHFDRQRYDLFAWCVMPNHVHVVVRPDISHSLSSIIHSWKSFTAKEANKALKRDGHFWQSEYYDHLVRSEADMRHCAEYILSNPQKGGLHHWKWVGATDAGRSDMAK